MLCPGHGVEEGLVWTGGRRNWEALPDGSSVARCILPRGRDFLVNGPRLRVFDGKVTPDILHTPFMRIMVLEIP